MPTGYRQTLPVAFTDLTLPKFVPKVEVVDSFNRPDSTTTLGATEQGEKTWETMIATGTGPVTWGISSSSALSRSSSTGNAMIDAGTAYGVASVTIAAIAATGDAYGGLVALASPTTQTQYVLLLDKTTTGTAPANVYKVNRRVDGAYVNLWTSTTAPTAGDVLSVDSSATALVFKINGVTVHSVPNPSGSTNTRFGFIGRSDRIVRFDNFRFLP
ncbi:hypothetical protein C5C36_07895 [Rathayibacter sp. AY1G1]|uniref:hypothetical protein n=1 Tax=unclassified Rathayibacter TaxID=2609250 RepID=UPI000CE79E55|nr:MULTISPECIES: hypothetical protein [unclassified Rathayibacter]PPG58770.1 hypothetical protein C5C57_08985 [Rathayibacter sp. AY1C5]PPH13452.1 hypothetical protein C5C36_07895 [Rathayibacter sp. AY1G1]